MTRDEFVAAAQAGGANHLATTDVQRFVDEAVRELTLEELWPWRVSETTVTAEDQPPIAVSNLGPIDTVRDSERRIIYPRRHSELVEARRDFTEVGLPQFYWRSAETAIRTWPISSVAVTVRHFSTTMWVGGADSALNGTDTPRAPLRWHDAIVHLVNVRCRMMDRDKAGAEMEWERYQARLEQARQAELRDNYDEPDVIRVREVY